MGVQISLPVVDGGSPGSSNLSLILGIQILAGCSVLAVRVLFDRPILGVHDIHWVSKSFSHWAQTVWI